MKLNKEFKKCKAIKLSRKTKEGIKSELLLFVTQNPSHLKATRTRFIHFGYAPVAGVLIIMLSAGTSFAAQGSLPGEKLYVVKTQVNERVQEMVSVGAHAKTRTNARLLEERLKEAEILAAQGRLEAELKKDIENQVNERAERINESLAQLATTTAYVLQGEINLQLQTHEEVVSTIVENFENSENLNSFVSRIQLMRKNIAPPEYVVEDTMTVEEEEQKAQENIEAARKRYEKIREQVHAAAQKDIEEKIEEGQKTLREGSILDKAEENRPAAQALLRQANQRAEQAQKLQEIHEMIKLKENVEANRLIERGGEVRGVKLTPEDQE